MKRVLPACTLAFVAFISFTFAPMGQALTPGEAAPAFRATDATGKSHTLSEHIGNWIVLEWFNPHCAQVQTYYRDGVLPELQRHYQNLDVVWLTISSEGRNGEDYLETDEALAVADAMGLQASAPILLDAAGVMGRAYRAQNTPHMYVINPQGMLIYTGALRDSESSEGENYLSQALDAAMAGEEVERPVTAAQGCAINY